MLRFVAKLKCKKLLKLIKEYGEVPPDNWPEYKAMLIESLRLGCKAELGCKDNILYWNMFATFNRYQEDIEGQIPPAYYADLLVTLEQLSRQHHPKLWAGIDKMKGGTQ